MAGYRQIHTQIWADDWFAELDTDEKLFFIYLFSNDATSMTGLYKLSLRVMVFESGLDKDRILQIFAKFAQYGKAYFEDGVVLVTNMQRYHNNASPLVKVKIAKDIDLIPDCRLKRLYLYGMDTQVIPDVKTNKIDESNLNHKQTSTETNTVSPLSLVFSFRDAERLYCEVTKFSTVTGSAVPMLDGLLSMLQDYGWDATLARCQSAFTAWTSRKRKDNGKPYSPTNPKWIEWAISGETDAAPESDVDRALRQMKEQAERFS